MSGTQHSGTCSRLLLLTCSEATSKHLFTLYLKSLRPPIYVFHLLTPKATRIVQSRRIMHWQGLHMIALDMQRQSDTVGNAFSFL